MIVISKNLTLSTCYGEVLEFQNIDGGFEKLRQLLKMNTQDIDVFIKSNYEDYTGASETTFEFVEQINELNIIEKINLYLVIGFVPEKYKAMDLLNQWSAENNINRVIDFPFKWPL